jgi:F-type H+-transporting ATPase subunit b
MVSPDFGLIFWQTLTFLVVLFILGKFAWKPILSSLRERENTIDEALNAAKKAKEEMQKLQADNEKLLAEARLERDKILRDAQAAANNIISEAKEKAGAEGARLIENARQAINNEKQAALTEVKNLAANLSIEIAEKVLKRELADEKAQKELVNEFIKEANLN